MWTYELPRREHRCRERRAIQRNKYEVSLKKFREWFKWWNSLGEWLDLSIKWREKANKLKYKTWLYIDYFMDYNPYIEWPESTGECDFVYINDWFKECWVIMRYVWQKDKNLKDIYEWDILKFTRADEKLWWVTDIKPIFYCEDFWSFCLWEEDRLWFLACDDNKEVIWNVFEHPHLLETATDHIS